MIELLKRVWRKRELLWYIVKLQMKAENKNKLLGFAWSFLDPLLLLIVYVVLVGFIFKRGGPQFPALLFIALLSWRWFTISLQRSVNSVTSKLGIVQSMCYLPLYWVDLVNRSCKSKEDVLRAAVHLP